MTWGHGARTRPATATTRIGSARYISTTTAPGTAISIASIDCGSTAAAATVGYCGTTDAAGYTIAAITCLAASSSGLASLTQPTAASADLIEIASSIRATVIASHTSPACLRSITAPAATTATAVPACSFPCIPASAATAAGGGDFPHA